jgi:hypothetical protein
MSAIKELPAFRRTLLPVNSGSNSLLLLRVLYPTEQDRMFFGNVGNFY